MNPASAHAYSSKFRDGNFKHFNTIACISVYLKTTVAVKKYVRV